MIEEYIQYMYTFNIYNIRKTMFANLRCLAIRVPLECFPKNSWSENRTRFMNLQPSIRQADNNNSAA